ncbi:DUF4861 family protein [Pareuzebyella sediminis]|uniref:DUF4861 family protein n=1 Tax=Pareuzebyella sediminis TaxID=2607998 RepID=UPI0011EC28BE|nr:DUF4861 family protein [Pareuzebyella sediminis]
MIINKICGVLLLVLFVQLSCKQKISQKLTEQIDGPSKTYAEISIKEGGRWEGRKYVGENITFKNVDFLRAPDSLTDHSYYIRYEGPGWESNKVGYRLYLDWRNAIDIFGKKVDTMVLSQVGRDNYDSYHENAPWGQDILKAGKSLGIGSYGRYDGTTTHHFQKVDSTTVAISNDSNASSVLVNYYGWKTDNVATDLSANLSIAPDSRMTKATLQTSEAIEGLVTGMVKFEEITLMKSDDDSGGWAYIATYGEQTLVPDKLGMALFYRKKDVEKMVDGEFDHLLQFKPTTEPISYYFLGAWEQEKNGITNRQQFKDYLETLLTDFNRQS